MRSSLYKGFFPHLWKTRHFFFTYSLIESIIFRIIVKTVVSWEADASSNLQKPRFCLSSPRLWDSIVSNKLVKSIGVDDGNIEIPCFFILIHASHNVTWIFTNHMIWQSLSVWYLYQQMSQCQFTQQFIFNYPAILLFFCNFLIILWFI